VWLVNARDVKHLPGRPESGRLDCVWLCKLNEWGMLRRSITWLEYRPSRRRTAATVSRASLARPSSVRFADFEASAAIFIPSSATVPSRPNTPHSF
jgi:hypothetical protein